MFLHSPAKLFDTFLHSYPFDFDSNGCRCEAAGSSLESDENRHLIPASGRVCGASKGEHHFVHDAFVQRCSYKTAKEGLRICMIFPAEFSAVTQFVVPSGKGNGSFRVTSSTTMGQLSLKDWRWLGEICLWRGRFAWNQESEDGSSGMAYQDVTVHGSESMHALYEIVLWGRNITIGEFFLSLAHFPPTTTPL